MTPQPTVSPEQKKTLWFVITASSVGTLIEWYDFYIFGSLATILSEQFFPQSNPTAAFLATLATFAAGFIVRPFGALVFGRLGDMVGRKYTFMITLLLMGGSTFAIGLIPGYKHIGMFAPALVLILRLLQGLALGGEYGGAATYVAEHAPKGKRGFYTSFIQTTATLGLFVSIGVILAVRSAVGSEAFGEWGWRVPFILSAVLVAVSVFIRLRMDESPLFKQIKASGKISKNPIKESFTKPENLKLVLIALFGAAAGQGVVWYTGQFYAMTFIEKTCRVEFVQTRNIVAIALLIGTPLFIYFGWLSDKFGRKVIMMTGMLLAVLLFRPLYRQMYLLTDVQYKTEIPSEKKIVKDSQVNADGMMMTSEKTIVAYDDGSRLTKTVLLPDGGAPGDPKEELELSGEPYWALIGLVLVQLVLVTMVYGPIAAFLVELFPTHIRYTSMSLPYHIGNGIFGGLTPFVATSLFENSKTTANPAGDPLAGLWYPIVVAAVTFCIGMIFLKNKKNEQVVDSL
ncbi:MFS transporter [Parachryseolinea silvisoli]|uniref:MFS transporter n=1 Tax=Parachryseolinea silvisoli TaxID=2873601 RepID=UPI002265ED69|nr:MFS transporter [Parachryseolinea silvisoli]MCD9018283.1 MHS family MFS transporter [Parachryseolinea silvisoli]